MQVQLSDFIITAFEFSQNNELISYDSSLLGPTVIINEN